MLLVITDYDGPFADVPFLDQAVLNVGIVFCEVLGNGSVFGAKDQESAIERIGKSAGELKFASSMRLASEAKMLLTKGEPLIGKIADYFVVKKCVIVSHRNF